MLPMCQDTGVAVFFVEIGDSVRVDGQGLAAAINEGRASEAEVAVRKARRSMSCSPCEGWGAASDN